MGARRRYVNVYNPINIKTNVGAGHFERRISFGYDADLSHVRAEFDGEILRVIVPRRTPPLTWYGEACE
jgi:HSP20 family molecular chaperone IbpA